MALDIPGMVVRLLGEASSMVAAYAQGSGAAEDFAGVVEASSAQVATASAAIDAAIAGSSGAIAAASADMAAAVGTQLTMEDALAVSAATAAESQLTLDGALAATTGAAAAATGSFTVMDAAVATTAATEEAATVATGGLEAAMGLLLGPLALVLGAIAATIGITMSLTSTYGELQKSEALLAATAAAHGISEADVNSQLQANAGVYAQYGQTVEGVRGTITRLIDANLTEQQAFAALPAIMDLAAAKGMSLGDATEAYTRSIAGGGRAMIDLGVQLSKVHGDMTDYGTAMLSPVQMTERLNTLNGALTGQLGDARNSATSMTQASAALGNAWDRLANTVGPPLMAIITGIVNVVDLAVSGFTTMINIVMAVVGAVERVISVLTHLDGSADTAAQSTDNATAAVDSLGSASTATAGSVGNLTTATTAATSATQSAAAATYAANGALITIKAGYDSLGGAIQLTTQAYEDWMVASSATPGGMTLSQFQAAGSPDQYISQGGTYGVTSAPYGYDLATGQPNPAPPARAAGGPVEAGQPYLVNEDTPRSEIFVPGVAGTVVPAAGGAGNGGGSHQVVTLTVNNPKPEPASTSIVRELQKLAAMGFLEPAR